MGDLYLQRERGLLKEREREGEDGVGREWGLEGGGECFPFRSLRGPELDASGPLLSLSLNFNARRVVAGEVLAAGAWVPRGGRKIEPYSDS